MSEVAEAVERYRGVVLRHSTSLSYGWVKRLVKSLSLYVYSVDTEVLH